LFLDIDLFILVTIEYPLEKKTVIGNSWVPQITPVKEYWGLYSSAGAYLARFFSELYSEKGYSLLVLQKLDSELKRISIQSTNQTFIDTLHSGYSQITFLVLDYKKCIHHQTPPPQHCSDHLFKTWNSILRLDRENKRTDAAPTLPIIPIPSLYLFFMQKEKLVMVKSQELIDKCNEVRAIWGNRFECRI
jgi:hypothetical protein